MYFVMLSPCVLLSTNFPLLFVSVLLGVCSVPFCVLSMFVLLLLLWVLFALLFSQNNIKKNSSRSLCLSPFPFLFFLPSPSSSLSICPWRQSRSTTVTARQSR